MCRSFPQPALPYPNSGLNPDSNPDSDANLNQHPAPYPNPYIKQIVALTHPHLVLLADATLEETLVCGVLAGAAGVRAGTLLACMRNT